MAAPEFFIYYRIAARHEPAVGREVLNVQRALQERFAGLHSRLLRRQGTGEDEVTLMETYRLADSAGGDAAGAELAQAIEQAAVQLEPWLLGARHVEVFEPCA